jgi:hypothetical protein
MKTFLVTGQAEYYAYVTAESEEEAIQKIQSKASAEETGVHWRRTMNCPLTEIKVLKEE